MILQRHLATVFIMPSKCHTWNFSLSSKSMAMFIRGMLYIFNSFYRTYIRIGFHHNFLCLTSFSCITYKFINIMTDSLHPCSVSVKSIRQKNEKIIKNIKRIKTATTYAKEWITNKNVQEWDMIFWVRQSETPFVCLFILDESIIWDY